MIENITLATLLAGGNCMYVILSANWLFGYDMKKLLFKEKETTFIE